jgi:translation initiation factor IF-2
MADPSKKRLGKVAQEFNVSTEKIVDLLNKKNYNVENNPNAKLDENMYEILVKEYAGERIVKENAQKKHIETPKKSEPVTVSRHVEEEDEVIEREVFIKDNTILKTETKLEGPKVLGKIDLNKPKVAVKPTQPQAVAAPVEPKVEAPVKEPVVAPVKETPDQNVTSQAKSNIKLVGSIDLDALNTKTKPAKKTEDQLRKEIEKRNAATEKFQVKQPASEEPVAKTEEPSAVAPAAAPADDVYKTEYQKLDGPKIMGKMDLDSIKKPVAKSDGNSVRSEDRNKKRRKRLPGQPAQGGYQGNNNQGGGYQGNNNNRPNPQGGNQGGAQGNNQGNNNNQGGNQGNNQGNAQGGNQGGNQGGGYQGNPANNRNNQSNAPRPAGGGGGQQRPGGGGGQQRPGGNTGGPQRPGGGGGAPHRPGGAGGPQRPGTGNQRFNKAQPAKDVKKVELTDEEIDRQIKETLARLSPTGKSKTSKHRRDKRNMVSQKATELSNQEMSDKKVIKVAEFLTANELATLMDVPVTQIISICMSIGLFVSINQRLDAETITLLADEFGFSVQFIGADAEEENEDDIDLPEDLSERSPIVTVMGHVDHGKTSLLDYIRNANVIAGEAGGITQHIGAYEVQLKSGKRITFLDTPGHEAFTAMRARGAKITDIAIIVIAADDSIMPQTIEAINHSQAANVPMVFAINKVDKPNAAPDKIREGLANMNILVEEWGGKYQSQEISAKKGINITELLEKVLIEAEMLELKANPSRLANGTVVESSLDKGKGYVAKILVQNGTLKIGDVVVAGSTYGRVKAMFNERNAAIQTAGPSAPLLLLGLNAAPQAGDTFKVYKDEHEAKAVANKRAQLLREQGIRTQKHITLDEIGRRIAIGDFKELNIIVKGDVDGSVEALSDSLLKLSSSQVQVNVIHKSVGSVTESDVLLASASNAIIIAFQVRPSLQARKLAETEEIDIRTYSIIYNAINEIKDAIEGMLSPEIQEKIVCNIEVREVFKITKVGSIAGSIVLDGKINRHTKIRVIRNGIVVHSGKLSSLKRFKDEVKEVYAGQDCGLGIDNYNDVKEGDIIEGYDEFEVKRTIK